MNAIKLTAPLALVLLAACSTVEYKYVGSGRELIRNDEGHVVGQKEMLHDESTGERFEQVTYFTPRRDANGKIIGYAETLAPGVVLRDLNGRRVGVRYDDLRSRGTNPRSDG